jgi:hypothetical protein
VLYEPQNQDTIGGVVSFGPIDISTGSSPFQPGPYEAMPTELTGSYKYAPSNLDANAGLFVEFYNGGAVLATQYQPFTTNASYVNFTLPISLMSAPDSMVMYAFAGENPGSVLHIDNLAFDGGDVGIQEEFKMISTVYPNPVEDQLYLRTDKNTQYQIIDIMGNKVDSGKTTSLISSFDVTTLQKGVYFFRLTQNGKVSTLKFIRK